MLSLEEFWSLPFYLQYCCVLFLCYHINVQYLLFQYPCTLLCDCIRNLEGKDHHFLTYMVQIFSSQFQLWTPSHWRSGHCLQPLPAWTMMFILEMATQVTLQAKILARKLKSMSNAILFKLAKLNLIFRWLWSQYRHKLVMIARKMP